MKVTIKDFGVALEIKSRGIELEVCETGGQHCGDLVLTMSKVVWRPGRTTPQYGRALTWPKFIELMEAFGQQPRRPRRRRRRS